MAIRLTANDYEPFEACLGAENDVGNGDGCQHGQSEIQRTFHGMCNECVWGGVFCANFEGGRTGGPVCCHCHGALTWTRKLALTVCTGGLVSLACSFVRAICFACASRAPKMVQIDR